MVAENDEEENNSLFSTRNFQQSNGGTTGLMETKVAIEDLKTTPSKPLFSKHQCLKENETPLSCYMCGSMQILLSTRKDCIKRSHKGDPQRCHIECVEAMKKCHSAEIKAQSKAQYFGL